MNSISCPIRLTQEVERLFDEMIHRPWGLCREMRGWNTSVDLFETRGAFVVEADLPGVGAEPPDPRCGQAGKGETPKKVSCM